MITEFLASNDNDVRDEDYTRPDWIEVTNVGDSEVSLEGWHLTDDASDLTKWRFPDVSINAGASHVVFASGKDRIDPTLPLHTNFRLNAKSGYLGLIDPQHNVAFDFGSEYPPQLPDVSFGLPQPTSERMLVSPGDAVRVLVPSPENGGDTLGSRWIEPDFADSHWKQGTTGVGYEKSSGYEPFIGVDVGEEMFEKNQSVFLRVSFDVADPSPIFSLTFSAQYDDGYVAYLNGTEVARRSAPDEIAWDSAATVRRVDTRAVKFEDVDLTPLLGLLKTGTNVLAIHALNDNLRSNDFLIVPKLTAHLTGPPDLDARNYFVRPTAGEPNGFGTTTALVDVNHDPEVLANGQPLAIRARLSALSEGVDNVELHYRVMFGEEQSAPMFDDGLHGDGSAGDGIWSATIPAGLASPGEMIRYRVTAGTNDGNSARSPVFQDPLERQQYYGTVVVDPSLESPLPIFELFLEDPVAADSLQGTRGALFYDGELYDNVLVDVHGFTTRGFVKKSHDVFFPRDHRFRLTDDLPRMKDINILTNYGDPTLLRNTLTYGTYRLGGTPSHLAFPIRVQQNGQFLGIYDFVEDGDDEFLEREGLDSRGALYKMDNVLETATIGVEKKTRTEEDHSDLDALVQGLKLTGDELTAFLYDHVNIPAMVNYLVGLVTTGESDCCHRNYYTYRDTEGNGLWQFFPWDVDKSLGRRGTFETGLNIGTGAPLAGRGNLLIAALFDNPEIKAMYLRRLRTLLDQLVQPVDTPQAELVFERRIDELAEQLRPEIAAEFARWERGDLATWEAELETFKQQYFPARRRFVYRALTSANGGEVVEPQLGTPRIDFGNIEYSPASGNQDEEYIVFVNPHDVAVDITGWRLEGGVNHVFHSGTVIPAKGQLYLSPNENAFRARSVAPHGGQGLFIQGDYSGHISNLGESIRLVAGDGSVVAETETPSEPTDAQRFLRLSEVMYHPEAADDNGFDKNEYEFIELVNTSSDVPLDLQGVAITDGIQFTFPEMMLSPGGHVVVASNAAAFSARYGDSIVVAGVYEGRLNNAGEALKLEDSANNTIFEFEYRDDWYLDTDGGGFSLHVIDNQISLGNPTAWRPSVAVYGSPLTAEPFRLQHGDANRDRAFDELDLEMLAKHGKYLASDPASWSEGDWNADGVFDQLDIVLALQTGSFGVARQEA